MFKVFNTVTGKKEVVSKIDYKIHFHVSGKPFDTQEVAEIVEDVEAIEEATPKKKGRPKAN